MASERKIDMVILGLLSHEPMTGYDIKKQIDGTIRFFWKGSFGNIYPALAAMEKEGYVTRQETKNGGRGRIEYSITVSGTEYLRSWLSSQGAVNELKYETIMKVFFGGVAGKESSIRVVEEFERSITEDLTLLKLYENNLSRVLEEEDHIYFYLTVLFGIETYEGYLRWCKTAKDILKHGIKK